MLVSSSLHCNRENEGRRKLVMLVCGNLLCISLFGCNTPVPPADLKPVSGIVRTSDGKLLTTGGLIEFRHTTDHKKRSTSVVDEQGHFSLNTANAKDRFPGAYPGEYKVAVYRKISFEKLDSAEPVTISSQGATDLEIVVRKAPP